MASFSGFATLHAPSSSWAIANGYARQANMLIPARSLALATGLRETRERPTEGQIFPRPRSEGGT